MRETCSLIWSSLVLLFRSRASLAAEILVLRHQINILRRHSPKRQTFSAMDRLIFAGLYQLAPTVLNALAVLKPDTVIKWHRAGFRSYWRWRSRRRGGRPTLTDRDTQAYPRDEHRQPAVGWETERCRMAQATAPILDSTKTDMPPQLRNVRWRERRFRTAFDPTRTLARG
jgi:hypothetical protein